MGGGWDISAGELADRLKEGNHLRLIDVREPHELEISRLDGATLIPLGQLAARMSELDQRGGDRAVLQIGHPLGARPGAACQRRFPQDEEPQGRDQCLGARSRSQPANLLIWDEYNRDMENGQKTILAVLAHPDDESFGMGGTLALYARQGATVHLVCATRGEAGSVDPRYLEGFASIAERRKAELRCAAEKLGLAGVHFLDYRDSGMPGSPDNTHPQSLSLRPAGGSRQPGGPLYPPAAPTGGAHLRSDRRL